ncbi:MAG: hypothetical protein MSC31_04490 [Solirubrobacteraceae bacterium MAG38_C4-C5]|nr:hypothetical protein [Candidatus Siliceabacter maunaloa]
MPELVLPHDERGHPRGVSVRTARKGQQPAPWRAPPADVAGGFEAWLGTGLPVELFAAEG